jgi:hypothetical protein
LIDSDGQRAFLFSRTSINSGDAIVLEIFVPRSEAAAAVTQNSFRARLIELAAQTNIRQQKKLSTFPQPVK